MSAALRTLTSLALIGFCSSQTPDCSYIGLLNHLNLSATKNVLAIVRPVKNWTASTLVQTDMVFHGISEVNMKTQTLTAQIFIQMRWRNEFLTWNSSDFCEIDVLTLPRSLLWIPDVIIQEDPSDTVSVKNSQPLTLYPDGLMILNARQLLTFTCQLNLYLFPFDEQSCNVTFLSLNPEANTLQLETFRSAAALSYISELIMRTQGEWQLLNMEVITFHVVRDKEPESRLVYMVKISRKPMLHVIILIIPLFYLLVLDLASFFIHEARGEKLSFKVTVLLSISVFLLILQDMLPSTEANLPLIANYCITAFTLVGISVLEAMLVSYLIDRDSRAGKKTQSSGPVKVEEKGEVKPGNSGLLPIDLSNDGNLLKAIQEEVRAAQRESERQDRVETKPGFYRQLAEIIDAVFYVLYFLSLVIYLVCMYMAWFPKPKTR